MPYIRPELRTPLKPLIDTLGKHLQETTDFNVRKGMLNYVITKLLLQTFEITDGVRYWKINDMLGVLDAVSRELYNRVSKPYESMLERINGDVEEYAVVDRLLQPDK
jgi:hypothetical protein